MLTVSHPIRSTHCVLVIVVHSDRFAILWARSTSVGVRSRSCEEMSGGNFVLLPPVMYAADDPHLALSSCFMLFSKHVSVTKWTVSDFSKQVKINIARSLKVCGRCVSDCMSAFPSMMFDSFLQCDIVWVVSNGFDINCALSVLTNPPSAVAKDHGIDPSENSNSCSRLMLNNNNNNNKIIYKAP